MTFRHFRISYLLMLLVLICSTIQLISESSEQGNKEKPVFECKRVGKIKLKGVELPLYRFIAKNLPPNKKMRIERGVFSIPMGILYKGCTDENGEFIVEVPVLELKAPVYEHIMYLTDLPLGTEVNYYLISNDKKLKMEACVIPFPNSVSAEDGAQISMVSKKASALKFAVIGDKFKPFERVLFKVNAGKYSHSEYVYATETGHINWSFMISDEEEYRSLGGEGVLEAIRDIGSMQQTFRWGLEFYNPEYISPYIGELKDLFKVFNTTRDKLISSHK